MKRAAWAANRIISTAPIAKFGAMKTGTPRSFAAASIRSSSFAGRPVVPTTAGTPASTAASTLPATASGSVKSTIASWPASGTASPTSIGVISWPSAASADASTDPTFPSAPKSAIFMPRRGRPATA